MKRISSSSALTFTASAVMLLAITSCGRDSIKVYQVDANAPAAPAASPVTVAAPIGMPATMPGGLSTRVPDGQAPLRYTLPAGWKEKELSQLRVASFSVMADGKSADVSVIPMGGMAGGDLANVNRWRGQVGKPPVAENEIPKLAEKAMVAGQPADMYDVAGTAPGSGDDERVLAVVLHRDDTAWFFKMTGDATLVEAQKPAFLSFLKSVEFAGVAAPSTFDLSQLPPSHPPIGGASSAIPAAPAGDQPAWSAPAGWQEGPLTQFLVAKYIISGAGGTKAEVNVSSLNGDGGGLIPNVNRWRAQLGLATATDAELAKPTTIDAGGVKGSVVELSGTNPRTGQPAKLVSVVLPLGGETWFYKLMGDPEIVAQQKDALLKFVQSARYPDVH